MTRGARDEEAMRRGRPQRNSDMARAKVTRDKGGRVAMGGHDRGDAWPWGDATEATRDEGRREQKGM